MAYFFNSNKITKIQQNIKLKEHILSEYFGSTIKSYSDLRNLQVIVIQTSETVEPY